MSAAARFSHEVLQSAEAVLWEQANWNRMVNEWYHGDPFQTMEHHQAWLCQVAPGEVAVRYVKVSAGGAPVAYFPLLESRRFHRFPARCLGFPPVGFMGPILDERLHRQLLEYFCESVLPRLEWDALIWERTAPESLCADALLAAFRKAGHLVAHREEEGNWIYVGRPGDYDAYLSSLGAATRREVRRISKRLCARTEGFAFRMFRNEECLSAVEDYDRVREASWKSAERHPRYIREMLRRLGAQRQTRMALVSLGGRPAAAQLWLCNKGRAYSHTCAFDAQFEQYSPGTFLLSQMIQSALEEDGAYRMDFLRGDEPYKQRWANRRLVVRNFAFFPATARGRLLHALEQRLVPFVHSSKLLTKAAGFGLG